MCLSKQWFKILATFGFSFQCKHNFLDYSTLPVSSLIVASELLECEVSWIHFFKTLNTKIIRYLWKKNEKLVTLAVYNLPKILQTHF